MSTTSYATHYDQDSAVPDHPTAISALDQQLDRLDATIERLHRILLPVLISYPEESRDMPGGGPASALRDRAYRLGDRLDTLDRLMNSIDL